MCIRDSGRVAAVTWPCCAYISDCDIAMVVCRLLTGLQITDVASASEAMRQLLETGVRTVVISSSELGSDDTMLALGSTVTGMSIVVDRSSNSS